MTEGFRAALLMSLFLLASCNGGPSPAQNGATAGAAADNATAASALEAAAIDAGVVTDIRSTPPQGLYRNRHEAGRDSLCIVANKEGQQEFALEAAFGENIECSGHGTLRMTGDKLVMNFARSACLIVATYEGDRVSIPGALDLECRALCNQRGSLEGVTFARVSREESVARAARDSAGHILCPS